MTPAPAACPRCGGPLEPDQEYCLRCGVRLAALPRPSAVGRAWERRIGRYPGDWALASTLLLLVAAGSATAGIMAARHRDRSGAGTIVAISPVVTAPLTGPVPVAPTTPAAPTTGSGKPRTTPPKGATRSTLAVWPARDGYTVVLASIPARGSGLQDATARAKAAGAGGVRGVGVLLSSRFASLHPGYYVVFAGVYGSLAEAETAAGNLSSRFPNAYARQIVR